MALVWYAIVKAAISVIKVELCSTHVIIFQMALHNICAVLALDRAAYLEFSISSKK